MQRIRPIFLLGLILASSTVYGQDSIFYSHVQAYSMISAGVDIGLQPTPGNKYAIPGPAFAVSVVGSKWNPVSIVYRLKVNSTGLRTAHYVDDGIANGDFPQGTVAYNNLSYGLSVSALAGLNTSIPLKDKMLLIQGLCGITSLKLPGYRLIHQNGGSRNEYLHTNRVQSPGLAADFSVHLRKNNGNRYIFFGVTYSYLSSQIRSSYKSNNFFEENKLKYQNDGITLSISFSPKQPWGETNDSIDLQ